MPKSTLSGGAMLTVDLEAHVQATVPGTQISYKRRGNVVLCQLKFAAPVDLGLAHGLAGFLCRQSGYKLGETHWTEQQGHVHVSALTLLLPPLVPQEG